MQSEHLLLKILNIASALINNWCPKKKKKGHTSISFWRKSTKCFWNNIKRVLSHEHEGRGDIWFSFVLIMKYLAYLSLIKKHNLPITQLILIFRHLSYYSISGKTASGLFFFFQKITKMRLTPHPPNLWHWEHKHQSNSFWSEKLSGILSLKNHFHVKVQNILLSTLCLNWSFASCERRL